jgi:glycosyltransferase involved in cell wall biosynthesis
MDFRATDAFSRCRRPKVMNIWIINHYAEAPDGLSTRSFDLARRMVERGHDVTIFTSVFSHYHFRNVRRMGARLWIDETTEGVRFVWVRTIPYRGNGLRRIMNMVSFAGAALAAGILRRPRPGVVSGVTVHPLAALCGYLLARVHGATYIIEVTDLWPQTMIEFGLIGEKSLAAHALRWLERFLYLRSRRMVMLWRHTEEYVASIGVPTEKILWLPHGVEVERYRGLEEYDGGTTGRLRVLYLGAFVGSMALETLIDAATILHERGNDNIVFRLVGAGTVKAEIVDLARRRGLQNVEFPEPLPKAEIGIAMSWADAFVLGLRPLSLYRFGMSTNKLTDYLAGGRPIIYYGSSSYNPIREGRAGITVPPGNPTALADGIADLAATSVAARLDMGRNGRAWALEHHDIPKLADRLLAAMLDPG